ncbi:MAG: nuclear transport factor 2 family protein [Novosphingobium sp.]|nr:nuclear transport factor 2 family protein [Novosphingobium sp.]
MKIIVTIAAAALAAQPLAAHAPGEHPAAAPTGAAQNPDEAAVRSVLSQYKAAIERLDATGTERLFAADATIFETGGVEGSYANYLAHHLGPELGAFKSFGFSDYKVDVRFEGPVALATETYNYRIETKKGEIAERRGVATSVLKRIGGQWKILTMHNSARKPKGS